MKRDMLLFFENLARKLPGIKNQINALEEEVQTTKNQSTKTRIELKRKFEAFKTASHEHKGMILRRELVYLPPKELARININQSLLAAYNNQLEVNQGQGEIIEKYGENAIGYSARLLAQSNKRFARTPLVICSGNSIAYMSNSFERRSHLDELDLLKILNEPELKETLDKGRKYEKNFENFNLTFISYKLKDEVFAVSTYLTPTKIKGKRRAYRIFERLGKEAVEQLEKAWQGLASNKEILDGIFKKPDFSY